MSDRSPQYHPVAALTRNRHLFRLILTAGVALGIVGATQSNPEGSLATTLHKVSVIIFLVLTVLQAIQTVLLASMDLAGETYFPGTYKLIR